MISKRCSNCFRMSRQQRLSITKARDELARQAYFYPSFSKRDPTWTCPGEESCRHGVSSHNTFSQSNDARWPLQMYRQNKVGLDLVRNERLCGPEIAGDGLRMSARFPVPLIHKLKVLRDWLERRTIPIWRIIPVVCWGWWTMIGCSRVGGID